MSPEIAPDSPETGDGNQYLFFAVSLAIIIAALEATVLLSLWNTQSRAIDGAIYRTSAPIIIALGILIQSKIIRYLGGIWLLIMGLASLWQPFSSRSMSWGVLTIVFLISGVLSVALAVLLLASKDFGKQFGVARSKHSRLKMTIRVCTITVGGLAAIIATYNDVVNLTR
jgi:hypothetical protein